MNLVMAVQQGCTFVARRRTVLALTTIVFTLGFLTIGFDLMGVNHNLIGVVLGASLTCIAWSLYRSIHRSIAGLAYFFGSVIFLSAAWDWLDDTPADPLFLGLACGIIFCHRRPQPQPAVCRHPGVDRVSGRIHRRHFADDLSGPLMLMVIGFVLIGLGALAVGSTTGSSLSARRPVLKDRPPVGHTSFRTCPTRPLSDRDRRDRRSGAALNLSGSTISANSCALRAASSSSRRFSSR